MTRRHFLFTLISLCVCVGLSKTSNVQLATIAIKELRPTQAAVGFKEVEKKAKKILKKQDGEFDAYLRKEAIPVVLGPGKQKYMIDGHHFLAAAYKQKLDKVYYEIVEDLSMLDSEQAFWDRMIQTKRVYLKRNGQSIQPKDLPKDIGGMVDDPYRTFAAEVRDEGGFKKSSIPFIEFMWADYFRDLIPLKVILESKEEAVKRALTLSRDEKARQLPGYLGE